jgi:exonuclease III
VLKVISYNYKKVCKKLPRSWIITQRIQKVRNILINNVFYNNCRNGSLLFLEKQLAVDSYKQFKYIELRNLLSSFLTVSFVALCFLSLIRSSKLLSVTASEVTAWFGPAHIAIQSTRPTAQPQIPCSSCNNKTNKNHTQLRNKNNVHIISYLGYIYNLSKVKIILSNDVQLNPGPKDNRVLSFKDKSNLFISSYNVRGCKDYRKQKRLINFFRSLSFSQHNVINLQETHLNKSEIKDLDHNWKYGTIQSPANSNSGGVAILYNKTYFDEIISTKALPNGRICSFTARKEEDVYLFLNIYAPNKCIDKMPFYNLIEELLWESVNTHPEVIIVISGDFNLVFDPNTDSINRDQNESEKRVKNYLLEIMGRFNLIDSYRCINRYGGYTWGRDNPKYVRSRLDHILISKKISQNILDSNTYLTPNESDHRLLITEVDLKKIPFGPGIIRVNSDLLNDPEIKEKVQENIRKIIQTETTNMNPHERLDYVKMKLRNLMLMEGKQKKNNDDNNLNLCNKEIERLGQALDRELSFHNNHLCTDLSFCMEKIDNLKEAIIIAKQELTYHQDKEAKKLIFRSRAKWAEKGEKSNKYFLNLLKDRQRKMQIRKIISNGVMYYKQDEISKAINEFYKDLYKKKNVEQELIKDEMFNDLPKLNTSQQKEIGKPLTLDELKETLKTCSESAPGPDGITYKTYQTLWDDLGPLIHEAWNHSCKTGATSNSQRYSVINLLEKKGKDKTIIENLRPISLSNCDIKLCTKTIAIRTNKILQFLIEKTQTGYVPGRQVTDNNRYLEEIIESYKKDGKIAYLITLDAKKAFDSVDHGYLSKILAQYGFPETYLHWIKVLYTGLKASVQVNGFVKEMIDIEQSVKQGDALSCALFILSIEPLLRSIRNNEKIVKVSLGENKSEDINNFSFADDITAVCENIDGIQEVINIYSRFSNYSGIQLNIPKTEIFIIGKQGKKKEKFIINTNDKTYSIYDQESVKICGVTFSNDKSVAYRENVLEKIIKLERNLNIWRQRNLTLKGKILIVKTFGLSQLIYSMQSTSFKTNELKKIEEIIFRFIWNIKSQNVRANGKIKRSVLKMEYNEGGLKAPDVQNLNESLKFKHYLRCHNNNHPIANYTLNLIYQHSTIDNKDCSSDFIKDIINVNRKLGSIIDNDVLDLQLANTNMHKYYIAYYQHTDPMFTTYFNKNQTSILKKLKKHDIITLHDINKNFKENTNINLRHELCLAYYTIPKHIRQILSKHTTLMHPPANYFPYKLNIWKPFSSIKSCNIRKRLGESNIPLNMANFFKVKHKITLSDPDKNPFSIINLITKETKLQDLNYKLLHNIYPTINHLYKWGIKDTNKCSHCGVKDDLKHTIYECSIASITFKNFLTVLKKNFKIDIEKLSYKELLLGTSNNKLPSHGSSSAAIDTMLLILKRKLILQREEKHILSEKEIIEAIIEQKRIELYKGEGIDKRFHERKWKEFA